MRNNHEIEMQLRARLVRITQRLRTVEDDLRQPLDADSSEQAVELADDEALGEVDQVLLDEAHDIRMALLRIERGEYGICRTCGSSISSLRLEALPTATLCIDCASVDQ